MWTFFQSSHVGMKRQINMGLTEKMKVLFRAFPVSQHEQEQHLDSTWPEWNTAFVRRTAYKKKEKIFGLITRCCDAFRYDCNTEWNHIAHVDSRTQLTLNAGRIRNVWFPTRRSADSIPQASKIHECVWQRSIYNRSCTFQWSTFIINIQEHTFIHRHVKYIHFFLSGIFACKSLAVHRDWNALSISWQVKFAPFITSLSPSTVIWNSQRQN